MNVEMMERTYCKQQEQISVRWENICSWPADYVSKRWMDILYFGKDDLLLETFGKPTMHVTYSNRNKLWGFKYQGFDFFFYRSVRGNSLQVEHKTPPKVIRTFIANLHKEWKKYRL